MEHLTWLEQAKYKRKLRQQAGLYDPNDSINPNTSLSAEPGLSSPSKPLHTPARSLFPQSSSLPSWLSELQAEFDYILSEIERQRRELRELDEICPKEVRHVRSDYQRLSWRSEEVNEWKRMMVSTWELKKFIAGQGVASSSWQDDLIRQNRQTLDLWQADVASYDAQLQLLRKAALPAAASDDEDEPMAEPGEAAKPKFWWLGNNDSEIERWGERIAEVGTQEVESAGEQVVAPASASAAAPEPTPPPVAATPAPAPAPIEVLDLSEEEAEPQHEPEQIDLSDTPLEARFGSNGHREELQEELSELSEFDEDDEIDADLEEIDAEEFDEEEDDEEDEEEPVSLYDPRQDMEDESEYVEERFVVDEAMDEELEEEEEYEEPKQLTPHAPHAQLAPPSPQDDPTLTFIDDVEDELEDGDHLEENFEGDLQRQLANGHGDNYTHAHGNLAQAAVAQLMNGLDYEQQMNQTPHTEEEPAFEEQETDREDEAMPWEEDEDEDEVVEVVDAESEQESELEVIEPEGPEELTPAPAPATEVEVIEPTPEVVDVVDVESVESVEPEPEAVETASAEPVHDEPVHEKPVGPEAEPVELEAAPPAPASLSNLTKRRDFGFDLTVDFSMPLEPMEVEPEAQPEVAQPEPVAEPEAAPVSAPADTQKPSSPSPAVDHSFHALDVSFHIAPDFSMSHETTPVPAAPQNDTLSAATEETNLSNVRSASKLFGKSAIFGGRPLVHNVHTSTPAPKRLDPREVTSNAKQFLGRSALFGGRPPSPIAPPQFGVLPNLAGFKRGREYEQKYVAPRVEEGESGESGQCELKVPRLRKKQKVDKEQEQAEPKTQEPINTQQPEGPKELKAEVDTKETMPKPKPRTRSSTAEPQEATEEPQPQPQVEEVPQGAPKPAPIRKAAHKKAPAKRSPSKWSPSKRSPSKRAASKKELDEIEQPVLQPEPAEREAPELEAPEAPEPTAASPKRKSKKREPSETVRRSSRLRKN